MIYSNSFGYTSNTFILTHFTHSVAPEKVATLKCLFSKNETDGKIVFKV